MALSGGSAFSYLSPEGWEDMARNGDQSWKIMSQVLQEFLPSSANRPVSGPSRQALPGSEQWQQDPDQLPKVLDVGIGTGLMWEEIEKARGVIVQVFGTDVWDAALRYLRSKHFASIISVQQYDLISIPTSYGEAFSTHLNVHFGVVPSSGEAEFPFGLMREQFDRVVCNGVLQYLDFRVVSRLIFLFKDMLKLKGLVHFSFEPLGEESQVVVTDVGLYQEEDAQAMNIVSFVHTRYDIQVLLTAAQLEIVDMRTSKVHSNSTLRSGDRTRRDVLHTFVTAKKIEPPNNIEITSLNR